MHRYRQRRLPSQLPLPNPELQWSLASALSKPSQLTILIAPRWSHSQGDGLANHDDTSGISAVGVGSD